jgi:hypothetical protein
MECPAFSFSNLGCFQVVNNFKPECFEVLQSSFEVTKEPFRPAEGPHLGACFHPTTVCATNVNNASIVTSTSNTWLQPQRPPAAAQYLVE